MPRAPETPERVKDIKDTLEDLQALKADFNATAPRIKEVIIPSRNGSLEKTGSDIRTRMLRNPVGIISNKRLSAFIFGDMLSPAEPFIKPKLMDRDPTTAEAAWFEDCAKRMHARMTGASSKFGTQMFEGCQDLTALGNVCTYSPPRKKGELPKLLTLPLDQVYARVNDEDETDTVYRKFTLKASIAFKRYGSVEIGKQAERDPKKILNFIHAVEPRAGGVKGGVSAQKPFTCDVVWADGDELVEEKGYDRMPMRFARFSRRSGATWGEGCGVDGWPAAWTANAITESVLRSAELANDPPLFGDRGIFGGKLDRRPGAFNPINAQTLFAQRIQDAVGKLDLAGDTGLGVQILNLQNSQVEQCFYIDWLALRDGPMMTAEEIRYRRQIRMQSMAPINTRLTAEYLDPEVEEIFFAMLEGGYFLPPPETLAGEEFGFEYVSPIALAQRGQHVQAVATTFDIATKAMAIDPMAGQALKADDMLREAARLNGISEKQLNSPEELQRMRQANAEKQAQAEQLAAADQAAGALQKGAQGAATLAQMPQAAA